MSSDFNKASGWKANDLRTRYVPKCRIHSGLASISPWLDFVLILFFFMFIESRTVLRPGLVVDLPAGEFNEGVADGMVMMVIPVNDAYGSGEVAFFNDEPYRVGNVARMEALARDLKSYQHSHSATTMTIYADKSIRHGTISRLVEMSRKIGLDRVNFGIGEKAAGGCMGVMSEKRSATPRRQSAVESGRGQK